MGRAQHGRCPPRAVRGLVEKEEFGGATSDNNLKTLHGGLRYFQTHSRDG